MAAVGENLDAPAGVRVIDATDRFVIPGYCEKNVIIF